MNIVKTNNVNLPEPVSTGGIFDDLDTKLRVCEHLAKARLVPDAYRGSPGDILIALQMAEDLGVSALAALTGIHIVKGRASISAEMMRSLVLKAGHRFRVLESTAQSCTVEITRTDDPDRPQEFTFTIQDAARAGLTANQTYSAYPTAMLLARATTVAVRAAAPDVLLGMASTEEMGVWAPESAVGGGGDRPADGSKVPDGSEPSTPPTGTTVEDIEEAVLVAPEPAVATSSETLRERATKSASQQPKPPKSAPGGAERASGGDSEPQKVTGLTKGEIMAIKGRPNWPQVVNRAADEGIPVVLAKMTEDDAQQLLAWSEELAPAEAAEADNGTLDLDAD